MLPAGSSETGCEPTGGVPIARPDRSGNPGNIADGPIADPRIGEITAFDLDSQPLEKPCLARLADQGPDPVPLADQLLNKMAAQQPGRPRDEDSAA